MALNYLYWQELNVIYLFIYFQLQIIGFMIAAMFFALMRQAYAWELDSSVPSILSALEFNLRIPQPFLLLYFLPILLSLAFSIITAQQFPSFASFLSVSLACYLIANGCLILLILSSKLIFYTVAIVHVFIKRR